MNGWKLIRAVTRIAVPGVVGALASCAHAPPSKEMSIVDAIERQQASQTPASCAAMNATAVCEKSTRLESGHDCRCVDPRALTGEGAFRF